MTIDTGLTDLFHAKASEGQLSVGDIQRLTAEAAAQRIRSADNDEALSHGSVAGRVLKSDQWNKYNDEVRGRTETNGKKDGGMDVLMLHLLDEIQRLNDELAGLRRDMAKMEADFEAEFGSEWHDAMADMYLSDDEKATFAHLSGDERDEAILQALKDKMLNPDGSIKDEYKDTKIAKYVQMHEQEKQKTQYKADLKKSVELDDPELGRATLKSMQSHEVHGSVNEALEKDQGAGLTGQFAEAVKTEAGKVLVEEHDAVDVAASEDFDTSFDSLFENQI